MKHLKFDKWQNAKAAHTQHNNTEKSVVVERNREKSKRKKNANFIVINAHSRTHQIP